jgi:NAD(P)-dependent dehydrogenase (short-subunit alcohol dehydrogenase family)
VFNCAGFVHQNTALTCTDEEWEFGFALNVRSLWKASAAVLPGMIERGRGSIIHMASAASSIKGAPNRFLYGPTKAAVIGMTRAMAADVVKQSVRVNCLAPGTVETPSWESAWRRTRPRREDGGGAAAFVRAAGDGPPRPSRRRSRRWSSTSPATRAPRDRTGDGDRRRVDVVRRLSRG